MQTMRAHHLLVPPLKIADAPDAMLLTSPPLASPAFPDWALPPWKGLKLLYWRKLRVATASVDWRGAPATRTGLKAVAAMTREEKKESFIVKKLEKKKKVRKKDEARAKNKSWEEERVTLL